jgi:transcriptional regulator with XRE-family HTH domain
MDARTFRIARGYSQEELAIALGSGRRKLQRFEAREPVRLTPEDRVRLHRLGLDIPQGRKEPA